MIQGSSVFLKLLEDDEIPIIVRILQDPKVSDTIYRKYIEITNSNAAPMLLSGQSANECKLFGVWSKAGPNPRLIGLISLRNIDNIHRTAWIGTIAVNLSDQKNGYITEAGRLIIEYAFNTLNLEKVQAAVLADHPIVPRMIEKMGGMKEGNLRGSYFQDGARNDELIYGLLRSEYSVSKEN